MRTQVYPPPCLMDLYTEIFPTLDFSRIDYYVDPEVDATDHPAYHQTGLARSIIVLHPDAYQPCVTPETFYTLLHELVHELQSQSQFFLWDRTATNVCYLFYGHSPDAYVHGNWVEMEAYTFTEQWRRALAFANNAIQVENTKAGIDWTPSQNPCSCDSRAAGPWSGFFGPVPDAHFRQAFDYAKNADPSLILRTAGCPATRCIPDNIFSKIFGYALTAIVALVTAAGAFWQEGPAAKAGTIGGGAAGGATGWLAGSSAGRTLGGVLGGIVGALLGSFVGGLVGALLDWLTGHHGSEGGSLNLMFSTDNGQSFTQKATFERSREQPALVFTQNQLAVAWTGIDSRVNIFLAPDKVKTVIEKSDASGPALAWGNNTFFLAWKGEDDHPNCLASGDGVNFGGKYTSGGDGPLESTPGVAWGNGLVYLAWVGSDNHLRLIHLQQVPGQPLQEVPIAVHQLAQTTGHKGTAALAFGNNQLFLAWSSFQPSHCLLNVMTIPVGPDGRLLPFDEEANKVVLNDWTNDTTGPALAFNAQQNRLYLAFTGADDTIWVLSSTDNGKTFPNRCQLPNERSRTDDGPAIAVHADGTVCVSWVGTDGD
jgi:hypothetical protein